jgi:predicted acyltransferase
LKQRYYSLDVFRGATVAFMILVNNPGSGNVFSPLEHAAWHGLTPTDLIFPFFLFAVGNAMAFVMPRFERKVRQLFGRSDKAIITNLSVGLFLTWYPFVVWQDNQWIVKTWTWQKANGDIAGIRILGVLARIALSYFFASIIIFYAKPRGAFVIGAILLLLYWGFCLIGNPVDPYSMTGWFGTAIDKAILHEPHMYQGEGMAFDPEGIMSTMPSIVEVIFGFLVGDYILKRGQVATNNEVVPTSSTNPLYQTLTVLFIAAVALLFAGYAWGLSFPINKKIWTSSYTVYTSGLATIVLATLIYAIELKGMKGAWSRFFDVFGKNALFIFALSSFIPKTLWLIRWQVGTAPDGSPTFSNPWKWFQTLTC